MVKLITFATFVYTIIIVVASLAKVVLPVFSGKVESDKIAHIMAYFVFAFIWALFFFVKSDFTKEFKKLVKTALFKSSIFSICFGLIMEIAQFVFTSYRQFDVKDMLANSFGVLVAMLIMYSFPLFFKLIKKRAV